MTQNRVIYGPISPVQFFVELKSEADRLSMVPEAQMLQCVGTDKWDMPSWFAGHVAALNTVVERYQTSLPQVDFTREQQEELRDKILGRPLYDQAFGRTLSTIETTLALLGVKLTTEQESAIRRQVQSTVNAIQAAITAEWRNQWWDLIKPQVEAINYTEIALVEGLGPKDKLEVYGEVFRRLGAHLEINKTMGLEANFQRLASMAVVDGLEACGLVKNPPAAIGG